MIRPTLVVIGLLLTTACSREDPAAPALEPPLPPPPAASASQITPAALRPVLGPLVARSPDAIEAIRTFDQRFMQTEPDRYQDFLRSLDNAQGAYLSGNHYGGLRSRLMWAIRNGEPYGEGVTDESQYAYARGRRIVKRYLQWARANSFNIPPHNNTGLADIEALYTLEGDADALTHIHVSAQAATNDPYGYLKMQNPHSDARQIAIALQAFKAAHRLAIPYAPNPATRNGFDASPGSWHGAGRRQIEWIRQYVVRPDGSIPSRSHNNAEAYLFNAMLATQLLEWCATVEWDPALLDLAQRIIDHLIAAVRPGWSTLGYLSSSGSPATDLAGFYVWPSLALWQETGDQKYHDFAVSSLEASNSAYIQQMKQWNQVFSTLTEGAEALLAGEPWR